MQNEPQSHEGSLLAQADWIRLLAWRMVGNDPLAEDLEQETYLAALTHPPARRNLRGWLGQVMQNALRQRFRSEERRRHREHAVARDEAVVETGRNAVEELLLEAVTELDEPFRTCIRMRYYEGLLPREIARKSGVPIDTVRSRLRRGLARMRTRLTDRPDWREGKLLAALVVAPNLPSQAVPSQAIPAPALATPATGILFTMGMKWKLALTVCVLASGVWVGQRLLERETPRHSPSLAQGPVLDAPQLATPSEALGEAERTPSAPNVDTPPPSATSSVQAMTPNTPAKVTVRGRTLGPDAQALGHVRLAFWPLGNAAAAQSFTSHGDGRFEVEVAPRAKGRVACVDPRYAAILDGSIEEGREIEPIVIVAPALEVAGRVQHAAGRALAGCRIEYALPKGFQARFPMALDASLEREFRTQSDAGGRFALQALPGVEGSTLLVTHAGYRPTSLSSEELSNAMTIVLEPLEVEGGSLLGRVSDRSGSPVAGARVGAGVAVVHTDVEGLFVFPPEVRQQATRIVAVHPGHRSATQSATPGPDGPLWSEFIELQLGEAPLAIHGKILDEDGNPVARARVWIDDPDLVGKEDGMPVQVEGFLAGLPSKAALEAEGKSIASSPNSFWSWTTSDEDGRFELGGLDTRGYRVKVMDPATLLHIELPEVSGGTHDLVVTMPTRTRAADMQGQVFTTSGEPIENAKITVYHRAFGVRFDNGSSTVWDFEGTSVRTDHNGEFEFTALPHEGVSLYVSGEGLKSRKIAYVKDRSPIFRIEMERKESALSHFRIELDDATGADGFHLIDAAGRRASLHVIRGGSRVTTTSGAIREGTSMVFAVAPGAYDWVLTRNANELARHAVTIAGKDVVFLRD